MAKTMQLSLGLSVIFLFFLISDLEAEDYVSKDTPPNEIVIKAVQAQMEKTNQNIVSSKFEKIIGKYKEGDDVYVYFLSIMVSEKGMLTGKPCDPFQKIDPVKIKKLDTNIWVLSGEFNQQSFITVLQK
jgi:hypothetical protein